MTQDGSATGRGLRTVLLVLVSLAVLGGAFALYVWLQSPLHDTGPQRKTPPESLVPAPRYRDDPAGPLGEGQGAWVRMFDKQGRASMQFRGAEFMPRDDNLIDVAWPEVHFFLADDQLLRVTGQRGVLTMQETRTASGLKDASSRSLTRGQLQQVKIELFDRQGAMRVRRDEKADPILTVLLDNVAFDSATWRIATQPFEENGVMRDGDQVPVKVTGPNYEMQGRGLSILWNERDRRLEMLEIAHGERLVIHDVEDLDTPWKRRPPAGESAQASTDGENPAAADAPQGVVSNEASPRPGGMAELSGGVPNPSAASTDVSASVLTRQPTYRVTFNDDVRVAQGQELRVQADTLEIDFQPKSRNAGNGTAAAGSSVPDRGEQTASPPNRLADAGSAPSASAPGDGHTLPAEQSTQPVVVEWRGRLLIRPVELPAEQAIQPGEAMVRMVGRPMVIRQENTQLEAGALVYRTQDQRVQIAGSTRSPVKMDNGQGAQVWAESLEVLPAAEADAPGHVVLLRGRGQMVQPLPDDQPDGALELRWTRSCALYVTEGAGGTPRVERAVIDGNVETIHPQLELRSSQLELTFAPAESLQAASRPTASSPADGTRDIASALGGVELRTLIATGQVRCALKDADGRTATIACNERMELTTASHDGKAYPRTLLASGGVKGSDGEQSLAADRLSVELKPVPRGDADAGIDLALSQFAAEGSVVLTTPDSSASGSLLSGVEKDDGLEITLSGEPARLADGPNRLEGPKIVYRPQVGVATVEGSGMLHMARQQRAGRNVPPVSVTWEKQVHVDSAAGGIQVIGQVVVGQQDDDGTVHTSQSNELLLTLVDKSRSTTRASSDAPSTTVASGDGTAPRRRTSGILGQRMDFLRDKEVGAILLKQDVTVDSTLAAEDGTLLRRTHLNAQTLRYDLIHDRVEVPGEGRLLIEDHRASADRDEAQSRGTTVMAWKEQLVIDQPRQQMQARGQVLIVHQPEGADEQDRMQLSAQQVSAELQPPRRDEQVDRDPRSARSRQLKSVLAEGDLHVLVRGTTMEGGQRLVINPAEGVITISGSERQPVVVETPKGRASWGEASYDMKTGHVQVRDFAGRARQ